MATCASCGSEMDDGARFCSQCGAQVVGPRESNGDRSRQVREVLRPQGEQPVATVDPSKPVWVGWPARIRHVPGMIVGAVLLVAAMGWWSVTGGVGPIGIAPAIVLGVVGLPLFLRAVWRMLVEPLSLKYWLTVDRLFVRRGILRVTTDQTELIRVDDIRVKQGLIDRLLGVGNVEIVSTDATDAALVLVGIVQPMAVAEIVRAGMQKLRRQRGIFMEQL